MEKIKAIQQNPIKGDDMYKKTMMIIMVLFIGITGITNAKESPVKLSGDLTFAISGQTVIDRHIWVKAEYIYLRNYEGTMIQETYNVEDRVSYRNNSDAITTDIMTEVGAIFFNMVQVGVGYQYGNPMSFNRESGQLSLSSAFFGIKIGDLSEKKAYAFTRIGTPTINATPSFLGVFTLKNDSSYWSVGAGYKTKALVAEISYSCWDTTMDYSRQYQVSNASTLEYLTEYKEIFFTVSKISIALGIGF